MAQAASLLGHVCPAILTAQKAIIGVNDPSLKKTPVGAIQALFDPSNRSSDSVIPVDSKNGHKKEVRVKYIQRGTEADVTDTSDLCTPGDEIDRPEQTVTVEQRSVLKIQLNEETMRTLCDGASDWKKIEAANQGVMVNDAETRKAFGMMREGVEIIQAKTDGLRRSMERKVLTSMMANVGAFSGAQAVIPVAPYSLPVLKSTDGEKIVKGLNKWQQQITLAQVSGMPLVIALGLFNEWNTALKQGCCNAGGTDFGKMASDAMYKYYKSFLIDDVFGQDEFLTLSPGSVQFVNFINNRGTFGQMHGMRQRGMMEELEIPGLTYDIDVMPNSCDPGWTIEILSDFDVWFQPLDAYAAGDPLVDTNGVFHFKAVEV